MMIALKMAEIFNFLTKRRRGKLIIEVLKPSIWKLKNCFMRKMDVKEKQKIRRIEAFRFWPPV